MSQPPYAKLRISKNGGAAAYGPVTAVAGDTIILSAESLVGWNQAGRYEIVDYPVGFAVPVGWSTATDGSFYYLGNGPAPVFTLPASPIWGKWLFALHVNGGASPLNPGLTDLTAGVEVQGPGGLRDLAVHETSQFHPNWVKGVQLTYRALAAGGGGGGGGGVSSVGATAPLASTGGSTPVISLGAATPSLPGSMSAADKTKLDASPTSATAPLALAGGVLSIAAATPSLPGSLSAADKTKLDASPTSATAPLALTGGVLSIAAATTSLPGSLAAADKVKINAAAIAATTPITISAGNIAIGAASDTLPGSMSAAHCAILNNDTHRKFTVATTRTTAAPGAAPAFFDLVEYTGAGAIALTLPTALPADEGKYISFAESTGGTAALTLTVPGAGVVDGTAGPLVVIKARARFTLTVAKSGTGARWLCSPTRAQLET